MSPDSMIIVAFQLAFTLVIVYRISGLEDRLKQFTEALSLQVAAIQKFHEILDELYEEEND